MLIVTASYPVVSWKKHYVNSSFKRLLLVDCIPVEEIWLPVLFPSSFLLLLAFKRFGHWESGKNNQDFHLKFKWLIFSSLVFKALRRICIRNSSALLSFYVAVSLWEASVLFPFCSTVLVYLTCILGSAW